MEFLNMPKNIQAELKPRLNCHVRCNYEVLDVNYIQR